MSGVFGEIVAVMVDDDVVGAALLIEPAGEGDDAALGSAELIDLGHDDGPGAGGDGWHGPLRGFLVSLSISQNKAGSQNKAASDGDGLALAEGVEVGEELGEADGGGFGSVDLGVALGSQCSDATGHGDA